MKKKFLLLISVVFSFLFSTTNAMAVSPADFPACSNPQGSQIAHYPSGIHGIVGSQATYSGSDTVYQVDELKTVQCFCPENGNGIQTNWFKAIGLSDDQIKAYQHDGWLYVVTGKLWGLSDDPYLAKNYDFTCPGSKSGSGGGSGNSQSGGGSSNGSSGGIVEASSAVLGLAGTGNTITLLGVATTGLVAFFLSFILRKRS